MSCPKTCNRLCVAIILISIGIIQLLAGIILLKSGDTYLLAGTDFLVAATNVLVGSLLGIAASVWDKKKKTTLKNTARQNVLAGLYISVLSMNATASIITILGDGNKLLISKDNSNPPGDFIFEILAGAYVTSVCSPIICFVIALVGLSGNRIQIYEKMKVKNSTAKADSYGWVFENNPGSLQRNLGSVLQDSCIQNASVSDDNVFLEKRSVTEKLLKVKPSKKASSKNSATPVCEPKTPMEIWNEKRNKILQEITSPPPVFFTNDYLQFPDYDSYIGTMIPRITETSFIQKSSRDNTQTAQAASSKSLQHETHRFEKTMSCKPSKMHLNELNHKLASRRMTSFNGNIDFSDEKSDVSSIATFEDSRKFIDEPDSQISNSNHSKLHRTYANSAEQIAAKCIKEQKQTGYFDFEEVDLHNSPPGRHDKDCSSDWLFSPHKVRHNSNDSSSSSSGLTAETISELKAKISKMNLDEDENHEQKEEFLRSFKHDVKRKSYLHDSDVEDKRSTFQKLHAQYGVISQNSESDSEISLAGEVVPIAIRPPAINRANSIPLKTICSLAPNRYSIQIKNDSHQRLDKKSNNGSLLNGESQSSQRINSIFNNSKERPANNSDVESNGSSLNQSERKWNFRQRMSFMGSIAESPKEVSTSDHLQKSENIDGQLSSSEPDISNGTNSARNRLSQLRNSFSLKRLSSKTTPSLLNRLWSMKRSETKADLTNLIMDSDSLVGLSDDELMARSSRLRQLRKSVELRSKTEKQDDIVLNTQQEA